MASPVGDSYSVESGKPIFGGWSGKVAHVWIILGQSNASGRADLSDAPIGTNPGPISGVNIFKRSTLTTGVGAWKPLTVSNNQYDLRGQFGSELQMMKMAAAKYYSSGDSSVHLIKIAKGGTSLAVDWADGSAIRNSVINDHLLPALSDLSNNFDVVKVHGVYWDQGEADAETLSYSQNYQANLSDFIAAIRSAVGVSLLPFVVRRMNVSAAGLPYLSNVIAAQDAVASVDPNSHLTDEAWSHVGDNLHLDGAAQNNQGNVVFNLLESISSGFIHKA